MPPRKRKPAKRNPSARKKSAVPSPSAEQPAPSPNPTFEQLVAVMARLRAPGGCPWDREQTHSTLRTYLIEEAYEVLDALDGNDDAKLAEELGDLLLQILFHSQIASEATRFSIKDVIRAIYEKMIRRHPHVFGEKSAKDAAEVLRNWEIIKQEERLAKQNSTPTTGGPVRRSAEPEDGPVRRSAEPEDGPVRRSAEREGESLLDGVPRTLPALLEGYQLTRKAARVGFDWDNVEGIFDKLLEEADELRHALAQPDKSLARIESEVGDILFVAVNLARFLNVDPEIAMKKTSAKFSSRFREMERIARNNSTTLADIPRQKLESLWNEAKRREQSRSAAKATQSSPTHS